MPAVTRSGDSEFNSCDVGDTCCPHSRSGTNGSVSGNVFANGLGIHRLTDTGPCNCPHDATFQSVGGSGTVFANGLPITRIGDPTICLTCGLGGNHVSGSGNVFAGG